MKKAKEGGVLTPFSPFSVFQDYYLKLAKRLRLRKANYDEGVLII
jgi:hypothetical protein